MTTEEEDRDDQRISYKRARTETVEVRDRWLVSYADLVTLLFALFVVLFASADSDRAQMVARAVAAEFGLNDAVPVTAAATDGHGVLPAHDALAGARRRIEHAFSTNEELRRRARVTENERGIRISLAEAGFFPAAEARMHADAVALIDALCVALRETEQPLRIEGHTDSTPISNARYPSNWELSAARASTVLARLDANGIAPARLSIAGYAGEHPVATNETSEGRALNRRVDVVVLRGEE